MKNYTYQVEDISALNKYLNSKEIFDSFSSSKSVLIQIFSSNTDKIFLTNVVEELLFAMPKALIVGSTSVGEIVHGLLQVGTTVLSISFFDDTDLKVIILNEPSGREYEVGKELMNNIRKSENNVVGILMLATPLSINVSNLFIGMSEENFTFPIFGGGAGVYEPTLTSLIFSGTNYFSSGAIAVVFLSNSLEICIKTFLGWKPLSKELTITESNGMILQKIDGENAFEVYNRYLDIPNDKNFFENALEFPILVRRNDDLIARVPFFSDENGHIGFLADIVKGEKFHIGYGDPESILHNSDLIQNELSSFEPDSIFLYACICRRFLLQNAVNLETQSFDLIAPTVGFYTYGEFFGVNGNIHLLNSTIVIAAFREGKKSHYIPEPKVDIKETFEDSGIDPFSNKHNRIITRLIHFITVVTAELEEANKKLKKISEIDKLTQINNRLKLDEVLQYEINSSERYSSELSILILDLDFFKKVNDNFGHLVGDMVLMEIGNILRLNVRETDTVGRWGGEEFLIILPKTNLNDALFVAEKIRTKVEQTQFTEVGKITCSIGVTSYIKGDNQDKLIYRADMALYEAKNSGRNRVSSKLS